jgi:hypothetical protein
VDISLVYDPVLMNWPFLVRQTAIDPAAYH